MIIRLSDFIHKQNQQEQYLNNKSTATNVCYFSCLPSSKISLREDNCLVATKAKYWLVLFMLPNL